MQNQTLVGVVRNGRKDVYWCPPAKAKELLATNRWEPALPPPVVKASVPSSSTSHTASASAFHTEPTTPAPSASAPKKKPE